MQRPIRHVSVLVVALMCVAVHGQAPPGNPAGAGPVPGFDMSGYWTAAMHEDALERGAGPELADYGGFPINEAARLFALLSTTATRTPRPVSARKNVETRDRGLDVSSLGSR